MSGIRLWVPRAVTPTGVRERVRITVADGAIASVEEGVEPADRDESLDGTLLPGLVDLQVNGGDGASYASADPAERQRATAYHLGRGTTSLLATLVSAPADALERAIGRLADDVDGSGPVVGIHVEGPFLSAEKSGAHARGVLCDPTPDRVKRLLEPARGALRLITLAPERAGALEAIPQFVREGAVVAAGHSLATYDQVGRAVEAGLSFVTHVGNASDWPTRPYDEARGYRRSEPGLVGAFLADERLSGSLVLDGLHLHPALARVLVELRGPARVVLVSDATAAAGLDPGQYDLDGFSFEVRPGGYAVAPGGGLAGSMISLLDAVRIGVEQAGLPLVDCVAMASSVPARLVGLERKGALRVGADADLVLVSEQWEVLRVYASGVRTAVASEPPAS
ncbi:MAG: amidohydrolase family protein [Deltaproteobacteria bacterium]|nr:amidohydrolase family protein [Deltaproteobacteria bacterium]MBW2414247.1 amidohydrolase family protein [Deltaproteobacteria bacterium]